MTINLTCSKMISREGEGNLKGKGSATSATSGSPHIGRRGIVSTTERAVEMGQVREPGVERNRSDGTSDKMAIG